MLSLVNVYVVYGAELFENSFDNNASEEFFIYSKSVTGLLYCCSGLHGSVSGLYFSVTL